MRLLSFFDSGKNVLVATHWTQGCRAVAKNACACGCGQKITSPRLRKGKRHGLKFASGHNSERTEHDERKPFSARRRDAPVGRITTQIICECGTSTTVPFIPVPGRKILCKPCYQALKHA